MSSSGHWIAQMELLTVFMKPLRYFFSHFLFSVFLSGQGPCSKSELRQLFFYRKQHFFFQLVLSA